MTDTNDQVGTRALTEDGRVVMPFEDSGLQLLDTMPGSRWGPVERCYHVSLALADRALYEAKARGRNTYSLLRED